MKALQTIGLAVIVTITAAVVSACLDDSSANAQSGSVTRAEYDALLGRVVELEANQPGDKVYSANTPAGGMAKAVSAGARQLGTAVGFLPVNVPAHRALRFSIKSPNGYLFFVWGIDNFNPSGITHINGLSDTGAAAPLYYASTDCSGQGYVSIEQLSDYGASQGVVFRQGAGEFNEINDDPNQFFYVPAGTARVSDIAYLSQTNSITKCTVESGTVSGYPALLNDPLVTGVESAPIPTPITMG